MSNKDWHKVDKVDWFHQDTESKYILNNLSFYDKNITSTWVHNCIVCTHCTCGCTAALETVGNKLTARRTHLIMKSKSRVDTCGTWCLTCTKSTTGRTGKTTVVFQVKLVLTSCTCWTDSCSRCTCQTMRSCLLTCKTWVFDMKKQLLGGKDRQKGPPAVVHAVQTLSCRHVLHLGIKVLQSTHSLVFDK